MKDIGYLGLDIHKRHVMVAAVNAQQKLILKPIKVAVQDFGLWAESNLSSDDEVALEASSNAWAFHDLLENCVAKVVVANPQKIKLISASASKTDRQDALILAKLLAANLLPAVWIPRSMFAIYGN
jgi:transposase